MWFAPERHVEIPADGALVQPPTDYIATFSQPVYGLSLTPGDHFALVSRACLLIQMGRTAEAADYTAPAG